MSHILRTVLALTCLFSISAALAAKSNGNSSCVWEFTGSYECGFKPSMGYYGEFIEIIGKELTVTQDDPIPLTFRIGEEQDDPRLSYTAYCDGKKIRIKGQRVFEVSGGTATETFEAKYEITNSGELLRSYASKVSGPVPSIGRREVLCTRVTEDRDTYLSARNKHEQPDGK